MISSFIMQFLFRFVSRVIRSHHTRHDMHHHHEWYLNMCNKWSSKWISIWWSRSSSSAQNWQELLREYIVNRWFSSYFLYLALVHYYSNGRLVWIIRPMINLYSMFSTRSEWYNAYLINIVSFRESWMKMNLYNIIFTDLSLLKYYLIGPTLVVFIN